MGCTYDIIEAKFNEECVVEKFLEMFADILGDDLYYGDDWDPDCVDVDCVAGDFYIIIEDEPLFCSFDDGEQLTDVVLAFLKQYPNIKFEATYNCTFNNCGDQLFTKYEYDHNRLTIKHWYADFYVLGCPECGAEWDEPIYTLDGEDECPECGANLELAGVDYYTHDIPLIDGEWVFPDDWEYDMYDDECE